MLPQCAVEAVGIENCGFRCKSGNYGESQETGSRGTGIKTRGKAVSGNRFAKWQNRKRDDAGKGGRGRGAHRRDLGRVGPHGLVELSACRVATAGAGRLTPTGAFEKAIVTEAIASYLRMRSTTKRSEIEHRPHRDEAVHHGRDHKSAGAVGRWFESNRWLWVSMPRRLLRNLSRPAMAWFSFGDFRQSRGEPRRGGFTRSSA